MSKVIILNPQTVTTPFGGGGAKAWDTTTTSSGNTTDSSSSSGGSPATDTDFSTARWDNWQSGLQGFGPNDIKLIVGSFSWSASGNTDAFVESDGTASSNASAGGDIFGGVSGSNGFFVSCGSSVAGPGPVSDPQSFSDGNTVTATFTPNTLSSITGARCDARIDTDASTNTGDAAVTADASSSNQLSSIQIAVTIVDRGVMVVC